MAIFRFFKMAVASILDVKNFEFLTVGRVKSVELLHHSKFRGDRSNRCRDIAFLFFKMVDHVSKNLAIVMYACSLLLTELQVHR